MILGLKTAKIKAMRDYEPYYTEDGSIGLYSHAEKDVYHSKFGAVTEAWEKFVLPSGVDKLLDKQAEIKVLDVCYGIGYNTKALISFILDKQKDKLQKIGFIKKCYSKVCNIVSIYVNKIFKKKKKLSSSIDTIHDDNSEPIIDIETEKISIDCLDINEELVKLSPMFKTIKTPGEIYTDIVPDFLSSFKTYYKLKNLFENFASHFYPTNRKEIKDLLELKFKNMHIDKEYKINNMANFILLNYMYLIFGEEYYSPEFKEIIKDRKNRRFLDNTYINYAKFNHFLGYNLSSDKDLSGFLHNIYYDRLSKRYKNIDFKAAQSLFNLAFYINDARKTIKHINKLYDLIFLDAFAYTKAPQLWSVEFISELYKRLTERGVILTYSNSAQIRNTLLENNLYVGKILNHKTGTFVGTIASKDKSRIEHPLNNYEVGLCNTKAGIPYHDPNLSFTNKEILELREYEFLHSNLMSSSKYMKIRSLRSSNE